MHAGRNDAQRCHVPQIERLHAATVTSLHHYYYYAIAHNIRYSRAMRTCFASLFVFLANLFTYARTRDAVFPIFLLYLYNVNDDERGSLSLSLGTRL